MSGSRIISTALCILVFVTAVVVGTLFHSFLHTELHFLDDNHLVVGSTTAVLSLLLIVTLYLRARELSRRVNSEPFQLSHVYEDNAFFRLLSEKSTDMVHLNGPTGTILYVNPVTTNLLGYPKDEILNRPASDFIHPDDREQIRGDMGRVVQGIDIPPREIRLLKKSGDHLDVEVKGFKLNADGEEQYIGAVLRDITSRRQYTELQQAKAEWEKIFDAMEDFVSVHDREFKVVRANRALCEMLGKSQEEIIGKLCYQLFHNLNHPYENCPHEQTAKTKHGTTGIISDPQIGVPLLVSCSPLFDNEGEFQGSVHIGRILDQQDVLNDKLKEMIPICAGCKAIRNNENKWLSPEEYFLKKHGSQFTHTVCTDCQQKLYPEYLKL